MRTLLTPPRVLLIAPRFFGYDREISDALRRNGYQVDLLPDRPFDNPIAKAVMRLRPELGGHHLSQAFFERRIEELGRNTYAIILVIQGEGVTARTLQRLRAMYPLARLVYYTWDSVDNKPFFRRNLPLYDCCFTFDPIDALKYDMKFRPLFFSSGFDILCQEDFDYDVSFIGTVHSDRFKIVQSLIAQVPTGTQTFVYFYMQARWMYHFRRYCTRTIVGSRIDDFNYEPLSKEIVAAKFFVSRAVIDIEHVRQRGATMRTMEALGSRRKLISTNAALREYDFYHPQNIHIIDRNAPRLDKEFLLSPYNPVSDEVRQKYSIVRWIKEVCGDGIL